MGISISKKSEFQAGHPWKSPEEQIYNGGKFSPDYVPPNVSSQRPFYDPSPLVTLPPKVDSNLQAKQRALNSDCILYTLNFMKYPTLIGLVWGATQASALARPDIDTVGKLVTSNVAQAGKGLLTEMKFVKGPLFALGGYAGLFAMVDCSVAKMVESDGILSTAVASGITGTAIGLHLRNPNYMFVGGFWGAALGAILKWAWMEEDLLRPKKTYYERIESRRRSFRPEFAEKMGDGYLHDYLDPGLEKLGLKLPETWGKQ